MVLKEASKKYIIVNIRTHAIGRIIQINWQEHVKYTKNNVYLRTDCSQTVHCMLNSTLYVEQYTVC